MLLNSFVCKFLVFMTSHERLISALSLLLDHHFSAWMTLVYFSMSDAQKDQMMLMLIQVWSHFLSRYTQLLYSSLICMVSALRQDMVQPIPWNIQREGNGRRTRGNPIGIQIISHFEWFVFKLTSPGTNSRTSILMTFKQEYTKCFYFTQR